MDSGLVLNSSQEYKRADHLTVAAVSIFYHEAPLHSGAGKHTAPLHCVVGVLKENENLQ